MTWREIIGYALLVALLGILGWQWLRWRRRVHQERMRRWGTTLSPAQFRRRPRS